MKNVFFLLIVLIPTFSFGTEKENYKMLNIQGFNVAAIYATDLEKSVKFYSEVLGFEKQAEMGGGVQMKLNRDSSLVIYIQGGNTKDNRVYDSSKISLSFHTSSVKAAISKVKEMGLPINLDYVEVGPNYAMFCFQDPSGNQIMLMGAP